MKYVTIFKNYVTTYGSKVNTARHGSYVATIENVSRQSQYESCLNFFATRMLVSQQIILGITMTRKICSDNYQVDSTILCRNISKLCLDNNSKRMLNRYVATMLQQRRKTKRLLLCRDIKIFCRDKLDNKAEGDQMTKILQ